MKHLIRKIFFWDDPAQGAFFALTLLFTLQRFAFTLAYGIILPIFLRDRNAGMSLFCLELAVLAVLVIYALVCLLHFLPKKEFSKASAVALCACAAGIL
ncbi:MAG: hypothetical protein IKS20_06860, partial [Victivallales bacterium]|nr:hypothetical protein [Victivallales bacterium]